jgi:hypothetical protein
MSNERLTLQAFVAALAELDSPLDLEVQKQVNEVGKHWEQPMLMANKLIEVARSYPALWVHYEAAERALLKLYEAKSKDKCIDVPEESNPVPPYQALYTTNSSKTKPKEDKIDPNSGGNDQKDPEPTESKLLPVLRAEKSVEKAKELKETLTKQVEETTKINESKENPSLFVWIFDWIKILINFGRKEAETQNLLNNSKQQTSEPSSIAKTVSYVWVSTIF